MSDVKLNDFLAYCKEKHGLNVYTECTNESDNFEKIFGIHLPLDIDEKESRMIHELFLNRDDAVIVLKVNNPPLKPFGF